MPNSKRVLVTGANGLLGSNIVRQLIVNEYTPVLLLRKNSNRSAINGLKCNIIEGDICNIFDLKTAIQSCEYVIHCAAQTDQKGVLKDFEQINIHVTALLIQLCKEHAIKRFIYISTANCFTNGTITNPGNEVSGFMSWLKKSGYAYSKYIAQQMVLTEAIQQNFPAIVLAPTFLIGPGDAKKTSGKLLLHGLNRRIVFFPPGGKSFINAEYAAEATVNALTKGTNGESYLLAGENMSYRQFYMIIKKYYNAKALLIKIPSVLLTISAFLFSFMQWFLPTSLTWNNTNRRLLCLNNYFSNLKAREHLGLRQTNTTDAIKNAYNWFLNHNYIV